jgi:hypothetical protein
LGWNQETTLERLARWRSIFTACHENPSSEVAVARSKKILQKLDDVRSHFEKGIHDALNCAYF